MLAPLESETYPEAHGGDDLCLWSDQRLRNNDPHISCGCSSRDMQIPAARYWEVEPAAPFLARTVPIRATMSLQKEGEEMLAMRAKCNDMERLLETRANSPDNLAILLDSRDAQKEGPQVQGRGCRRCLWKPDI